MNEVEQGKSDIEQGKITAITSYILIIGVLIALSMNAETKNKKPYIPSKIKPNFI